MTQMEVSVALHVGVP